MVDLLVIGDSFCADRDTNDTWPYLLNTLLSGEDKAPRGEGKGGASWWETRKNLLREFEIKIPDVLVICHTEQMRLPNDYGYSITTSTIASGEIKYCEDTRLKKKLLKAAEYYYAYLASPEILTWVEQAWYKELDQLLSNAKVPKVVHLFSFTCCSEYYFNHGVTVVDRLDTLCVVGNYKNHFTPSFNKTFAGTLFNIITDYKPGRVNLEIRPTDQ
jgi:hypothetical protein